MSLPVGQLGDKFGGRRAVGPTLDTTARVPPESIVDRTNLRAELLALLFLERVKSMDDFG